MIILPGGRNCSKERQKDGSRVRDDFDQADDQADDGDYNHDDHQNDHLDQDDHLDWDDDDDDEGDDVYEKSLSVLPSPTKFSLALVPSTSPPPSNTFY